MSFAEAGSLRGANHEDDGDGDGLEFALWAGAGGDGGLEVAGLAFAQGSDAADHDPDFAGIWAGDDVEGDALGFVAGEHLGGFDLEWAGGAFEFEDRAPDGAGEERAAGAWRSAGDSADEFALNGDEFGVGFAVGGVDVELCGDGAEGEIV